MKEIKESCYKGTRILLGNEKQDYIQSCREYLKSLGFVEIQIPIIQYSKIFESKVGEENNNMMYNFQDSGNRDLCLAPEYTAIIQQLSKTTFVQEKDVKVFYVAECFRGEKPQSGRYRQFTQFGVEIINPSVDYRDIMCNTAEEMIKIANIEKYTINTDVTRGLDYYEQGKGFEIACEELGSSKQVCGGGSYDGGIGFAIGIDRILTLLKQ